MKRRLLVALLAVFAGVLLATGCTGPAGMTGVQGPTGLTGVQGPTATAPLPAIRQTSLKDFMFDYDRSDIRYSESRKPAEIATDVSQNPSVRLGIDSYTDSRSSNQYNLPLSQRRVATIRDALIQAEVPEDRIETGNFGTDRLACNPASEQCAQREGRVELLVRASH